MRKYVLSFFLSTSLLTTTSLAEEAKGPLLAEKKVKNIFDLKSKWQTDRGKSIQMKKFAGKYTVISLAYTSCRFVCGFTMTNMKNIEKEFGPLAEKIQFVVFTIDPLEDSIAKLKAFRKKHKVDRKNWYFLLSSKKASRELAGTLGMGFGEDTGGSHIMHTRQIALLGPKGKILEKVEGLHPDLTKMKTAIKNIK